MNLKEGTLEALIKNGIDAESIANIVVPHMLRALDCIACKDIIHRDVKPANILYVTESSGRYQFQLGDFGLCNWAAVAVSTSGTPLFMAPEIDKGERQSCKVDVWSLFITLLWTLDINGFRRSNLTGRTQIREAILNVTSNSSMSGLKQMAVIDPLQRASVAQMLIKYFNGDGLTTPRNKVPVLPTDSSPVGAPSGDVTTSEKARTTGEVEDHGSGEVKARLIPRENACLLGAGIRKRGTLGRDSSMSARRPQPVRTRLYM